MMRDISIELSRIFKETLTFTTFEFKLYSYRAFLLKYSLEMYLILNNTIIAIIAIIAILISNKTISNKHLKNAFYDLLLPAEIPFKLSKYRFSV